MHSSDINQVISKVMEGRHLTAQETEAAFTTIFNKDTEGYQYLALCTALHTKGETADELLGICRTTQKLGITIPVPSSAESVTDLCGTGGGVIKTINVSTLASCIVAASGVTVIKQAMFGITSPTGSADVFKAFGIDVFSLTLTQVKHALKTVYLCPVFISALSPKLQNRSRLVRLVFAEKGVKIKSPFNLATFAYSPTKLTKRIYGCYSEKYLITLAQLFYKLGNEKTLVVHGVGGLPEASNFGQTVIVEQNMDRIQRYVLTPKDFGVQKSTVNAIRSGGRDENICDFLRILDGKEMGPKRDLVLINAATSFYVLGKVATFEQGTDLARSILEQRLASQKFEQLVRVLGDSQLLKIWRTKAGI
jgi:anthranilate phosphoribosyltransferase